MKPDYNRSIVNIPASLLTYYGLDTIHASLHELKDALKSDYNHVALVVLDGFGMNLINRLDEDAFLRRHTVASLTSTFPSTTVAATTALLTGETPYESGHIGWFQYVKPFGIHYTVFLEEDYYFPTRAIPDNLKARFTRESIFTKIGSKRNDIYTKEFFPFPVNKKGFKTLDAGLKELREFQESKAKTLSYVYSIDPDITEHITGTMSDKTLNVIQELNESLERYMKVAPKNTLLIVTADHGLTDVKPMKLFDDLAFVSTFKAYPAIEPRATTFFIKEDEKANFEAMFTEKFGAYFELFTLDEFMQSGFLGFGKKHQLIDESLGDYLAIAKDHYYFELSEQKKHLAHHAGLSQEEMEVPLILLKKDDTYDI
ncbi:MAG: alkaline phosphatase family protein [Bacillota bacterium]